MGKRGLVALFGAGCLFISGCDRGPPVRLADDPVGQGSLGIGGAGGEGVDAPLSERPLHWARGHDGIVRGTLISTGVRRMEMEDRRGNRYTFEISPGTVIRRGEDPSSALVLEPGVQVEATYLTWKGTQVLAELNVLGPPQRRPSPSR